MLGTWWHESESIENPHALKRFIGRARCKHPILKFPSPIARFHCANPKSKTSYCRRDIVVFRNRFPGSFGILIVSITKFTLYQYFCESFILYFEIRLMSICCLTKPFRLNNDGSSAENFAAGPTIILWQ